LTQKIPTTSLDDEGSFPSSNNPFKFKPKSVMIEGNSYDLANEKSSTFIQELNITVDQASIDSKQAEPLLDESFYTNEIYKPEVAASPAFGVNNHFSLTPDYNGLDEVRSMYSIPLAEQPPTHRRSKAQRDQSRSISKTKDPAQLFIITD
jgi:hypothetical protein